MLEPVRTIEIYQKPPSPMTLKAGDPIFKEGEPGDIIYGILTGEVELWINNTVVETIQQGDLFGEGALVHADHKRFETAIAKTDCLLTFLDRHHFLFVVQQTPLFALEVMRSYSDRLRALKGR
ncbi:MAG: cyclic nucleotide-binding domain-containing protein [Cyanobacteria bacterium P01_H01_bin.105]